MSFGVFDSYVSLSYKSPSPIASKSKTPANDTLLVFLRKYVLSDPSAFEEPLLDDTITVVVDENGDFLSVNHLGPGIDSSASSSGVAGEEDGKDALSICMERAKQRYSEVFKAVYT